MASDASKEEPGKGRELGAFLFVTVGLAPIVTVAIVGAYGFAIWMVQLIAGPPAS